MAEYSYKGNTLSSQQASSTPSSQKSPADIKKVVAPTFSWRFLLPNYWLIWVGVIVLYTLSWLPFAIIVKLGSGFGRLIKFIAPKRVQVAKRNIALCFKDWPKEKVNEVLEANIKRTGMGFVKRQWDGGGQVGEYKSTAALKVSTRCKKYSTVAEAFLDWRFIT
jgi:hypothetical protein